MGTPGSVRSEPAFLGPIGGGGGGGGAQSNKSAASPLGPISGGVTPSRTGGTTGKKASDKGKKKNKAKKKATKTGGRGTLDAAEVVGLLTSKNGSSTPLSAQKRNFDDDDLLSVTSSEGGDEAGNISRGRGHDDLTLSSGDGDFDVDAPIRSADRRGGAKRTTTDPLSRFSGGRESSSTPVPMGRITDSSSVSSDKPPRPGSVGGGGGGGGGDTRAQMWDDDQRAAEKRLGPSTESSDGSGQREAAERVEDARALERRLDLAVAETRRELEEKVRPAMKEGGGDCAA